MKSVKLLLVLAIIFNFILQSCNSKDNPIQDQEQAENSPTTKKIMYNLSQKILHSVVQETANDINTNLEFDYCFNFVYPIVLSYNSGTEVVIENASQLLNILYDITETLYIDGIVFPFDITTAQGIQTITNESDFLLSVSNCDVDNDGIPNYDDNDDDNDGVSDLDEDINNDGDTINDDTDNDGIPNYQDIDDDNDGINTADEDNDHDGDVSNDDSDNDGTPDYLDTDSDNDGIDDGDDTDADGDGVDDDQEENDDDNNDNEDDNDEDDNEDDNG